MGSCFTEGAITSLITSPQANPASPAVAKVIDEIAGKSTTKCTYIPNLKEGVLRDKRDK